MIFLWLIFSTSGFAAPATDICEILKTENCAGVSRQNRRANAQSLPSTTSASQFNPANVSHDRGLGVEAMYLPGQSPTIGLVAGTGKAGAALVSTNQENGFFSNRTLELDSDFLKRRDDVEPFDSDKYGLAIGAGLLKNRNISWDVGVLGKYNTVSKRVNGGVGTSLRVWVFSLGLSSYSDDQVLKFGNKLDPTSQNSYATLFDASEYHERYTVHTAFGGVRLGKLFLDTGVIRTRYEFYGGEPSTIHLYSAAYIVDKFLFNVALRHENSPMPTYKNKELVYVQRKNDTYVAIQYSVGKNVVLGVHHNYYLLRELAVSGTVFF